MPSGKPVIGVIACSREVESEPAQAVKHRYLEGVSRYAGAIPLIVPVNQPAADAGGIVRRLDALLLTGSASNIAPARYASTEAAHPPQDVARDEFSAALVQAAIAGKPVFGICRGLQEINVALGGSLLDLRDRGQAAPDHHAPEGADLAQMFEHFHEVEVVDGTLLDRLSGQRRLTVNSVHHQTIDRLADGLRVNAVSPDGVVEAVSLERPGALVFAVQWHPEWQPSKRPHDLAFWHLLGEAARGNVAQLLANGSLQ